MWRPDEEWIWRGLLPANPIRGWVRGVTWEVARLVVEWDTDTPACLTTATLVVDGGVALNLGLIHRAVRLPARPCQALQLKHPTRLDRKLGCPVSLRPLQGHASLLPAAAPRGYCRSIQQNYTGE